MQTHATDILIIGAGPAGMAAALAAAQSSQHVTLLDDNPHAGGQIWRGEAQKATTPEAQQWLARLRQCDKVEWLAGTRVLAQAGDKILLAEQGDATLALHFDKLILATGGRERFLPFPGWTLPNVMGAGGLQALVKTGLPMIGQRVAIAGTGPLLLAVAAYLETQGAKIAVIAEQAPFRNVAQFGWHILRDGKKRAQALKLMRQLRSVPKYHNCWPAAALGETSVNAVRLQRANGKTFEVECDYLACGFHLVPNGELAAMLGCTLHAGFVPVDEWQKSSQPDIYCAGEAATRGALGAFIGGVEVALAEGEIAGYAATGDQAKARAGFTAREQAHRFAAALEQAYALRPELKQMPQAETLVCRCEDVPYRELQRHTDWRAAKLHTRCGMGACQGRVCGSAVEFLFNWQHASVRPPVFPARIGSLAQIADAANDPNPKSGDKPK